MSENLSLDPDAASGRVAERFALATFLARWAGCAHQDLAASDSQSLPLAKLLDLANAEDLRRWHAIGLGYADPRGDSWLRASIATRYRELGAEHVLACAGAQEATTCVLRALLRPDDHAIVVVPIYQPSELAVTGLCMADGVPLDPGRGWRLDLDLLAATVRPNTRLVLTNFPNSPTGATIAPSALDELVAICRRHRLWLVNDEVYRQTEILAGAPSAVDSYERGISVDGLSKGFGMPGLRVGWVACRDKGALDQMLVEKSMLSSCLSRPSEVLANVALRAEHDIVARTRGIGQRNLHRWRRILDRFPNVFGGDASANLAFGFPRFHGAQGASRFANALARQAGLVVLPSSLWRSSLAPVPDDHLRLGLGRTGSLAALDVLEDFLLRSGVSGKPG